MLNTAVTSVEQQSDTSWTVTTSNDTHADYDSVILAAPFHLSNLTLTPYTLGAQIPEQPYVHLHVTLFTTKSPTPAPACFNMTANSTAPIFVLTTSENEVNGGKAPEFEVIEYLTQLTTVDGTKLDEYVVKIFSLQEMTDEWLDEVFNGQVGWVYRKEVGFMSFYVDVLSR